MTQNELNKVKIRLKLRSGEEFEAEGSPEFIEKQRADFLQLIGKSNKTPEPTSASGLVSGSVAPQRTFLPKNYPTPPISASVLPTPAPVPTPSGLAAAEYSTTKHTKINSRAAATHQAAVLFEQIVKEQDGVLSLRRKSRLLTPETAALLLIGAAKLLLNEGEGYSALALSKSLTKSGYGGGRLDRILASEIRQGTIKATGSKRSRAYLLSDEGFARAYVLAEKLAGEWH